MKLLTLLYFSAVVLSLLPWSYTLKAYGTKIRLRELVKEIGKIKKELGELPEGRSKKRRVLIGRYKEIRRRISRFIIMNLLLLWLGIIISLIIARSTVIVVATLLGIQPLIPSPLDLPYISESGYLSDLVLFLVCFLAYIPWHNRITGLKVIQGEGR